MNVARDGSWEILKEEDGYTIIIKYSITNFIREEVDNGKLFVSYNSDGTYTGYEADGAFPEQAFERFESELKSETLSHALRSVNAILQSTPDQLQVDIHEIKEGDQELLVQFGFVGYEAVELHAKIKKESVWCYLLNYKVEKGYLETDESMFDERMDLMEMLKNHPKVRLKLLYLK